MKRALALAMTLLMLGASVVAADAFPLPGHDDMPRGNGWRVVYADRTSETEWAYRVEVATSRSEWYKLWPQVAGLTDFAPYVNFDNSIVAVFGTGTGSCTTGVRFDGVVFNHAQALVHARIAEGRRCGFLDLNGSAVFAVALSRARLPAGSFTVQLGEQPVCRRCADPPDSVTFDL